MVGVVGSTKILKKIKSDLFLDFDRTQCSSSVFNKFSVHDIMCTSDPIAIYRPTHKQCQGFLRLLKFPNLSRAQDYSNYEEFFFAKQRRSKETRNVLCNVWLTLLWACQKQNITYFCQARNVQIFDSANICLLLYEYCTMSRLVHYVMFCTTLLYGKPYFTMKINNN
jgi:hypothetical protein